MLEFICTVPLLSALFSACAPPLPLATGYVEGEYVLIAPVAVARIEEIAVARGDRVARGQTLVRTETRDAVAARAEAQAALAAAEARLENLLIGRRAEEIRVIEAALASARAQAAIAEKEVARIRNLNDRGIAPEAQLDAAISQVQVAHARVAEVEANLAVARLPARPKEIEAARAAVDQARARLETTTWQLERRTLSAPAAGRVFEVLHEVGEIAGPSAPVLSLLPDGAVKLRLYVPESAVAGIGIGTRLAVSCDGCAPGTTATVTYVADAPEFTPPVIYSLENRQKLVYLVEARPDAGAQVLKPGQIVDVDYTDPLE